MTNLPEIPNNINTVEKLHLWSALLLDRQNPTKRIIELPGEKPVNLIDVDIYRDGYNKKQVLCRANLPLQDFSLYEGNGLWNLADEIQTGDYNPDIEEFRDNRDILPTPIDPFADNVVLYLKGEGENNSTDIIDSSPNPKVITVSGNTKISTAIDPTGSIYFDGSGDYLSIPSSNSFDFDKDFTLETWCYANLISGYQFIWDRYSGGAFQWQGGLNNNKLNFYIRNSSGNGALINLNSNLSISSKTWTHLVIQRKAGVIQFYINGIKDNITANNTTNLINNLNFTIGKQGNSAFFFNGYLQKNRVTKGIARCTTNFNPETDTYLN